MKQTTAYLSATLSAIIVGFSFMFVKSALVHSNPINILAHRFTVAFIAMLLFMLITKTKVSFHRADLGKLLLIALLYPLLFFTLQTYGLLYMPSSQAGIIFAMSPVVTLIISTIFLKEKATTSQKFGLLASVLGVIFLQVVNGASNLAGFSLIGLVLIVSSVASMSINQVLAKQSTRNISFFDISFISLLVGFIAFNLLALWQNSQAGSFDHYFSVLKQPDYLWSIIFLGALSSFGTTFLNLFALSRLSTIKVSIFSNFSTLVSILAGVIILKEPFSIYHFFGAAIIIVGVLLVNFAPKKEVADS